MGQGSRPQIDLCLVLAVETEAVVEELKLSSETLIVQSLPFLARYSEGHRHRRRRRALRDLA